MSLENNILLYNIFKFWSYCKTLIVTGIMIYYYYQVLFIWKTIILPLVLYGCETLSLIVRNEHRQRMFGDRVQRSIFEPKRDELKRVCR
jgi:hypothetical protein